MEHLFNYGEFLLCFGPVFLIMGAIGLMLLWNSWPANGTPEAEDLKEGGDKK